MSETLKKGDRVEVVNYDANNALDISVNGERGVVVKTPTDKHCGRYYDVELDNLPPSRSTLCWLFEREELQGDTQ